MTTVFPKNARLLRKVSEGAIAVREKKTVEEMERELGLDRVIPAALTTDNDVDDDADYFADWYEEELRKRYER
ncbi:hypothetical protein BG31_03685 [Bacillus subtilis subsp. subtilis]|uniref:hypothetical protein n=1 Tax=Bacillus TaxID=1386 RepID=UPI000B6961C5|nr:MULTISPECIES: hypothetical protein [Bacillus]KAF1340209.1 hypothetical protein ABP1_0822 [Bacillus subtilis]MCY9057168.1 hypothetical protein [Bacillus inaquosorum]MED3670973.1 hypothetical protein [Bacillus subtilis]NUF07032.1 hypothetical protein [Bacillus rugosus]OTQ89281.1 hypothetical protein BG31_03685 [Bacillus subtilis subsp. subtilis]